MTRSRAVRMTLGACFVLALLPLTERREVGGMILVYVRARVVDDATGTPLLGAALVVSQHPLDFDAGWRFVRSQAGWDAYACAVASFGRSSQTGDVHLEHSARFRYMTSIPLGCRGCAHEETPPAYHGVKNVWVWAEGHQELRVDVRSGSWASAATSHPERSGFDSAWTLDLGTIRLVKN